MLFNSVEFFIFFVITTTAFFVLPHRFRWLLLLVASCVFYAAFIPIYLLILFAVIVIDYFAGIQIEQSVGTRRKFFLWTSWIANIGVLAVFKYYNFLIENINGVVHQFGVATPGLSYLEIALPVGLSFHTFQAMSYTYEVYRGHVPAERRFGIYSLFVMFYPQLVAGPIERPQEMLPQFYEEKKFDFDRVMAGLQRMLWGLFKKVVVADLLAIYVDSIYRYHERNTGLTLLLAAYAFAFQVYCDFSGYCDIAIGAAQVMGYKLRENFRCPFFAKSITEFWRRWHISLSTWLRDYVYIPLGGSRKGEFVAYRNLLFTMFIGGLWHGASWNYVLWGVLHGVFLSIEKAFGLNVEATDRYSLPKRLLMMIITFNVFSISLVIFRATSLPQAGYILTHIFKPEGFWNLRIQDTGIFAAMTFGVAVLLFFESAYLRKHPIANLTPSFGWGRSLAYSIILIFLIVGFGVSGGDQFIYFQF